MFGQVHGLMILPSEKHLFPKKNVKPMFRYSERFQMLPGMIWMYQVDAEPCPHYDDEKGCTIYSKRPVICQSFPFEPRQSGAVAIHESCPEIARLITEGYKPNEIRFNENYIPAMIKTIKFWEKWLITSMVERYDIKEKKWSFILEGVKRELLVKMKK